MTSKVRSFANLVVRYPHVTVCLLIAITMSGFVLGMRYYADESRKQTAYATAKTFEQSISALHLYYSKEIVSRARNAGVELSADYTRFEDRLPFPATFSIEFGKALRQLHPDFSTSLYSHAPFPARRARVLDEFEKASLSFLEKHPEKEFVRIQTIEGREVVRFARSMNMKSDCVDCHNNPEYGLERIWKVGDMRGARQV